MDTPTHIANRIVAAVVDRFADDNGIARGHLTTDKSSLTPADVVRATTALGTAVVFDGR